MARDTAARRAAARTVNKDGSGIRLQPWRDPREPERREPREPARRSSGGMDRRGGRMVDAKPVDRTPRRTPKFLMAPEAGRPGERILLPGQETPPPWRPDPRILYAALGGDVEHTGEGMPSYRGGGLSWDKPRPEISHRYHEIQRWLEGEDINPTPKDRRPYGPHRGQRRFVPRTLEPLDFNERQLRSLAGFEKYITPQAPENEEQARLWFRRYPQYYDYKDAPDKGGINPNFKTPTPMPEANPDFQRWVDLLFERRPDIEAYMQYGIPLKPEDQAAFDEWVDKYIDMKQGPHPA